MTRKKKDSYNMVRCMGAHSLYSALNQRGLLDPIKPAYNQSRPDGQLKLTARAFSRLWISMPANWSLYLLLRITRCMLHHEAIDNKTSSRVYAN